jgi:hypothetical protein
MWGRSHGKLGRTPASGWLHRLVRRVHRATTCSEMESVVPEAEAR